MHWQFHFHDAAIGVRERDLRRRAGTQGRHTAIDGTGHDTARFSVMLDHTGIVVTDLAKARAFYDAIAKPLGLATADNGDSAFLFGKSREEPIPYLWIGTLIPSYWVEGSRPGINQMHVAFIAPTKQAVHEFHAAGIAAGGRDNGEPGPRDGAMGYYGAFLLDPDGNNIEACYRDPVTQG